jgi:WD40 repeat protein
MDSTVEQIAHLEQLIAALRRRRRVIETQRAGYGPLAVPAHIEIELEDIARQLPGYEAELRRLRPQVLQNVVPYLGLWAFQEADAARFFGRDTLVADLVSRIVHTPFLAVLGASGSGKSSLVRAGLIPQLRAGALDDSSNWRFAVLKPGAHPLDALATELARLQSGSLDSALQLSRSLAEHDRALLLAADMLLDHAANQRLVLVVDQFEELWTQQPPADERKAFIDQLLSVCATPDAPLRIVLTMRADFLHHAIEQQALAEQIERHMALISPLQAHELRDAIVRPAADLGGSFEPGLVDELIAQVQHRQAALPLLEYTLLELWKAREHNGLMTWAAYHALGGIEGALAARADTIVRERYTAVQQDEVRQLLLRLIQPGEGAADTRRRVLLDDLVPAGGSRDAVQLLLKPLADERLLVMTGRNQQSTVGDRSRMVGTFMGSATNPENTAPPLFSAGQPSTATIEIAHEALIRAWPTLGHWIGEARADLRFQLQLEEAARSWEESERDDDLLWGELRLAQAAAWQERSRSRLNARDQAFLDTSRAAVEKRRRAIEAARHERERLLEERATAEARNAAAERRNVSRLRIFLALGAMLLLATAGLATYALRQTQQANAARVDAETQRASAETQQAMAESQRVAAETQRAAAETQRVAAETQRAAAEAQANAGEALFEVGRGNVDHALLLAQASVRNNTPLLPLAVSAIRETTQRSVPNRLLHGNTGYALEVAWSPDGKQVLTGSADDTAKIWDAASGNLLRTLQGHTDDVRAVEWSPDSKQILTGSIDNTARFWDAASGQILKILQGHTDDIWSVAWSPDGKQVLTGSDDHTARIWNVASGEAVMTLLGHTDNVVAVAWSPDSKQVLTGSNDHTTIIWDVTSLREPRKVTTLQNHTSWINEVAWSPDGKQILTGSNDHTTIIWDANSGQVVTILRGHTASVYAAAWSPDGKQVLTGSDDHTARIWDVTSGQVITTLSGHTGWLYDVAWSPDGKQILTGRADTTAKIWDVASGQAVMTFLGQIDSVNAVAWSPDGKQVLTDSDNHTARIWDVASGQAVMTLSGPGRQTGADWE